jgi:predicted DNA-binding transcriptional regulator YafY
MRDCSRFLVARDKCCLWLSRRVALVIILGDSTTESLPVPVTSMAIRSKRHPKLLELIVSGDGKHDVDSLARALRVSGKTIRRDLDDLRRLGFAIVEHGPPHAAKTLSLDKHSLSQLKLTYDEVFSLLLYRLGNSPFEGTLFGHAAASAFAKVEGAMGPVEKDYVGRMMPRVRRNSVGGDYSEHADAVEALTVGIEDSKAVEITYLSARSTEPVTYLIEPYGMVEHRGTLYVVGHSKSTCGNPDLEGRSRNGGRCDSADVPAAQRFRHQRTLSRGIRDSSR